MTALDKIYEIIDRLPELKHLRHYDEICFELAYFANTEETLEKLRQWGVECDK